MIVELHEALLEAMGEAMPDLPFVAYPRLEGSIRLPVALLELTGMQRVDRQPGTGQTAIDCDFTVSLVAAPEQEHAELGLRAMAARLMHALARTFRPMPGVAGHVRALRAEPGAFRPELDGYLVWEVAFAIELYLGEADAVTVPGLPPREVYLGIAPKIGRDHIDDYWRIE